MKYNIGDVVILKRDILYQEYYKGKIGIILEVAPEINTCRVLVCGDTNATAPLGVWVISEAISEVIYKSEQEI